MRTSIASVCLSGGLVEKLHACAAAGFDGVEIMDADLTAAAESPEEIRALCTRLGLSIDMFQPFRDAEGVTEDEFADVLRRAESKFQIMNRLGTDLMLVCSNVATAVTDDIDVSVRQLGELADRAAAHGIRLAFEALAWGRYVNDYRRTWEIVRRADRPNLGLCLDSFHILSLAHDPSAIEQIPAGKIYFLQLADAPALEMDVLSWSRHHRLFPGEGDFDLTAFVTHVMRAGYTGPWSLEVFNDTFRQTDAGRTAAHAHRSLVWLADRAAAANGWLTDRLGEAPTTAGLDFVEVAGSDLDDVDQLLAQLGFAFEGRHRSKPVRLWSAGSARVILNEQLREDRPRLSALGLRVSDEVAAADRALALGSTAVFRRTYAGEQELRGVVAPDGTQVFWSSAAASESWLREFEGGTGAVAGSGLVGDIDHVNLAYAWQDFDEAVLFMSSVLSLTAEPPSDVPGPLGLIRSQVMRTPDGIVRVPMNLAPPTAAPPARHIAVRTDDVFGVARRARERGIEHLRIPANYYDDLDARFALDTEFLAALRELDLLYDRDDEGEFIHFYTRTIGDVFFEVVERRGGYDGYGGANAPIRLAAQRATDC